MQALRSIDYNTDNCPMLLELQEAFAKKLTAVYSDIDKESFRIKITFPQNDAAGNPKSVFFCLICPPAPGGRRSLSYPIPLPTPAEPKSQLETMISAVWSILPRHPFDPTATTLNDRFLPFIKELSDKFAAASAPESSPSSLVFYDPTGGFIRDFSWSAEVSSASSPDIDMAELTEDFSEENDPSPDQTASSWMMAQARWQGSALEFC